MIFMVRTTVPLRIIVFQDGNGVLCHLNLIILAESASQSQTLVKFRRKRYDKPIIPTIINGTD